MQSGLGYLAFNLTKTKPAPDQIQSLGITEKLPEVFTIERAKAGLFANLSWSNPRYPEKIRLSSDQEFSANKIVAKAVELGFLVQTDKLIFFADPIFQDYFCASLCSKQAFTLDFLKQTRMIVFESVWPIWAVLDPEVLEKLNTLMMDNATPLDARERAIHVLGFTRTSQFNDNLAGLLLDKTEPNKIKYAIMQALAKQTADDDQIFTVLYNVIEVESDDDDNLYKMIEVEREGNSVRRAAVRSLGQYLDKLEIEQAKKHITFLETNLIKSQGYQTAFIIETLYVSKKASPQIVAYLLDLLNSEAYVFSETIRNVMLLLPQLAPASRIIEPIKGLLTNKDGRVRISAVDAIARSNPPDLIPLLLKQLFEDPDPQMHYEILLLLGDTDGKLPAVASQLIALFNSFKGSSDAITEIKHMIIELLARTGEKEATDFLVKVIDNPDKTEDHSTRASAANALMDITDPSVIDFLRQAYAKETDARCKSSIDRALHPLEYLNGFDRLFYLSGLRTLDSTLPTSTYLRDPRAFDIFQRYIRDKAVDIKIIAIRGLGVLKDKRAIGIVMEALGDPEAVIRYEAALTLGRLGAKEALPQLEWLKWNDIKGVDQLNKQVRYAAAQAITQINSDNN